MSQIPLHEYLPKDEISTTLKVIELNERKGYNSEDPHRHGYYEIFFFETAGGTHTIDFEEVEIKQRSIHAVSPGQVHILNRKQEGKGTFIVFSTDAFEKNPSAIKNLLEYPFLNNNSALKSLEVDEDNFNEIMSLVTNLKKHPANKEKARKWLELILIYIKDAFEEQYAHQEGFVKSEDFKKFKLLLESNFHQEHLSSWYAEKLNLTQNRLNDLIKQYTGVTVSQNINNRIILEAKRLIKHSTVSFKEISYDLGFNDPAYFTRFMKNNTGKSPKELRE
jgi:AraC-like DNA-binding protein/mannose-6-phosphate isomerase-like protein (cupin superfamily)